MNCRLRERREEGFTLIELLIAITISSILIGAIGTAFLATMKGTQNLHETFVESHDAQLLATYLTSDAASADPVLVDTASTTATGCGGPTSGTNVLRMEWSQVEGSTTTTFAVSYRVVGSTTGSELIRYYCEAVSPATLAAATASYHVVAHNLSNPAVQTPAVATSTSSKIEMALVSLKTSSESAAYTFNLSAAMRVPAVSLPFDVAAASGTKVAGTAFNLTVTAKTADNSAVDTTYSGTKTITFSGPSSSPNGNAPTASANVTFTNGVGTASITLYNAASPTTIAVKQATRSGSVQVNVNPASTSTGVLTFSACPDTATNQASSLTVSRVDAYGNQISTTSALTVTLTKTGGLAGASSATIASGSATSPSFSVTNPATAGTTVSLTGSASGFTSASCSYKTTSKSFLIAAPSGKTAGQSFSLTITASNDGTTTDTSYDGDKTLTFSGPGSSPGGQSPSYPATVHFTSGVGTATLTLFKAETVNLTTSDGTRSNVTSVTVAPGSTSLSFSACGSNTKKNKSWSATINRQDNYGNAGSAVTNVTLTKSSGTLSTTSVSVPANSTSSGSFTYTNPNNNNIVVTITASASGHSDATCSYTTTN